MLSVPFSLFSFWYTIDPVLALLREYDSTYRVSLLLKNLNSLSSSTWNICIFLSSGSLNMREIPSDLLHFQRFPVHSSSQVLSHSVPEAVWCFFSLSGKVLLFINFIPEITVLPEFSCSSLNFFVTSLLNYQLSCNILHLWVQLLENCWYRITMIFQCVRISACITAFEVVSTFLIR